MMPALSRRATIAALATAGLSPTVAASPALESLITAHAAALVVFNATIDVTGAMEARGANDKDALRAIWDSEAFKVASEAEAVAAQREEEAGCAIIAYPCRSMADVIRKANYMASVPTIIGCGDGEKFEALIRSLIPLHA